MVSLTVPAASSAAPRLAAKAPVAARGDFDGDGKADLVAGAPGHARVRVVYTKAKPGGSHAQWISAPDSNAFAFGSALAVGDFNGDGFADLAVGAPGYTDIDGVEQGAVFIYSGSKSGLHYHGVVFKGPDDPDNDNELGASLSAGKVNADRFADLAIGNPGPAGGGDSTGSARLLFGSTAGLTTTGERDLGSILSVENGDFGTSVLLADVNGDGHADLVVGEPGGGPAVPSMFDPAGDIQIFYGAAAGLGTKSKMILGSTVHAQGALGTSLAGGFINRDRYADVVAGAPDATVGGKGLAGKVVVFAGGKNGLSAAHSRVFSEASRHVPGEAVSTDRFGFAVAVGDLTGDHRADVIVGAPGATASTQPSGGAVYLLRGTKAGVTAVSSRRLTQGSKGVPGAAISGSQFGQAVATLGSPSGARRYLVVGIPAKHKGGVVEVLHITASGLAGKHPRVLKDPTIGDAFGTVFAA
jgi:hypothetical protein